MPLNGIAPVINPIKNGLFFNTTFVVWNVVDKVHFKQNTAIFYG